MSRLSGIERTRKEVGAEKRRAVEDAIHALAREGHPITFRTLAKRAGVSRVYLYKHFRAEISGDRETTRSEHKLVDGKLVPLRTMEEYRHLEAVVRNKLERVEIENRRLRTELAAVQRALELERGKSEHWRQQYEQALRPKRLR
jgi:AcrR family transcriptional regulator